MSAVYRDMFERTRASVEEVNIREAQELIASGAAVLDVREADEVEQGIIPGAVHVPRGFLEMRAEELLPNKGQPVVIYCAGGIRSVFAAKALQELGYAAPVSLSGGFGAWKGNGLRFDVPKAFTPSSGADTAGTSCYRKSAKTGSESC